MTRMGSKRSLTYQFTRIATRTHPIADVGLLAGIPLLSASKGGACEEQGEEGKGERFHVGMNGLDCGFCSSEKVFRGFEVGR